MKSIFVFILTLLTGLAMAQNFEGKVVYSMEITGLPAGASSEQMAQYIPKQQIMYYKNGSTRTESVGGMMPVTIVVPRTGEGMFFINDDKKQALHMDKKQIDDQMKDVKDMKVTTKKTTETRMIAGYKCTKYMVTIIPAKKDDKKMETVVWAADDLKPAKSAANNPNDMLTKQIEGLPLITTIQQGPMNILLTATDVKAMPLDEELFIKPAGYTQEPFSQEAMMKSMR